MIGTCGDKSPWSKPLILCLFWLWIKYGLILFVTLKTGAQENKNIEAQLKDHVVNEIGAIAKPDEIKFTDSLPKTRSGKIMRRILRKIAEGDYNNLGDISTLADPSVVKNLISENQ